MPRFFLPESFVYEKGQALPTVIEMDGEDAFHLSVSLRARIGDEAKLCTQNGFVFSCRIAQITGGKKDPVVIFTPFEVAESREEPPCNITLFQGIPKGKKTDSIIQKCTELGVSRIVFVYTDYAVPAPSDDEKKITRFQKIAEEACKQCGRGRLVKIDVVPSLEAALPEMQESDICFACYENESGKGLKELLKSDFSSASFFVGPEGGISEREVQLLRDRGILTVSLGERILRTETVGSAVLSMFLYEKEL